MPVLGWAGTTHYCNKGGGNDPLAFGSEEVFGGPNYGQGDTSIDESMNPGISFLTVRDNHQRRGETVFGKDIGSWSRYLELRNDSKASVGLRTMIADFILAIFLSI